ncbi:M23 family metallopeptidase [Novosphingobium lentum]|uniref:M23 family metallopeptidase n=1 Tax=Novosphingobium lentum TaxID=145287 RepID=UPI0008334F8F|nr:M23 family metallopeptidase [Novosphingobium lentum]
MREQWAGEAGVATMASSGPDAASAAAPGPASSPAPALSLAVDPALEPARRRPASWREWRSLFDTRLRDIDWVPDLAEDIGSRRWFRGMATMLALGAVALALWPDFSPVEAATTMALDSDARAEFRTLAVRPLSYGSANGRHVAPTDAVIALAAAPERPTIQLAATLGEGDSFGRMLQRAGVGADDAARVSTLVAGAVPLGEIGPGTRIDITLGQRSQQDRPRPLTALSFRARFDLKLGIERRGAGLALSSAPIAVDSSPLRIRGIVGASLYRSARAAGAPPSAIQDYLRTLDDHISFEQIDPADEFDIVIANRRAATGETQAGELLYAGLEHDGKPRLQLMRWGQSGGFFEASGFAAPQQDSGMLGAPVSGAHITSGYGLRRHPILGFVRMHAGIDFAAPWGSPIYAMNDGVVSFAGRHGGHGNYVRLEHSGGLGTGYGHMSRIAVSPGARVSRGQVIGYVGSTGLSTGPHLHYELYRDGRTVDPNSVRFAARQVQVDTGQLSAFRAKMAQLLAIHPGVVVKRPGF